MGQYGEGFGQVSPQDLDPEKSIMRIALRRVQAVLP